MLCFWNWGKGVFHVPVARCLSGPVSLSARTQRPPVLICSSRSPSRLHIIKIIPQPSAESLFVTWLAWLGSVKSLPITVSGTMVYSRDHSPWLVWREWFVNHYSAPCRVRNTWGMQIMCHQIDSCAAKSEKLQLLLSQIGFFFYPISASLPSLQCFQPFFFFFFWALTQCVYFSALYWARHLQPPHCSSSQTTASLVWTEKGNIRLRLLIDVHPERTDKLVHDAFQKIYPCSVVLACCGEEKKKHPIKANCDLPVPVSLSYIVYW